MVFPMLVGVFLLPQPTQNLTEGLPHACGGVSIHIFTLFCRWQSSPCLWGCFCERSSTPCHEWVFPMLVGVFLAVRLVNMSQLGLPHACGGVSIYISDTGQIRWSSPCLWGCFLLSLSSGGIFSVFPMLVGVFHQKKNL